MRALLTLIPVLLPACEQRRLVPWNSWLAISANSHDFGEIPHGEVRRHRFVVENTSPQRVRLKGIRNQCTCAVLEKRVLAGGRPVADRPIHDPPKRDKGGFLMTWLEPGEQLELTVRVDTTMRPPLDHVEPSLSELYFEPQEAGMVVIHYRFKIRSRLRILSQIAAELNPTIDFGQFNKHQEVYSILELAPRDGRAFEVLGIDGADERLRLTPKPAMHDGGHRWELALRPTGKLGPFARTLRFRTDLPGDYVLPIQVTGVAVGNLQIQPFARLDFGRFDFREKQRRFVTLVYHLPQAEPGFRVGQVEIKNRRGEDVSSYFEAGVDGGAARRWTLWLQYRGGLEAKAFEGWVQLKSDDPEHESTLVRFTGFNGAQG